MRIFPHAPDVSLLSEMERRLSCFLAQSKGLYGREMGHRNGEFFRILADQWLALAALWYLEKRTSSNILFALHNGVDNAILSRQLSYITEGEVILRDFSAALITGDQGAAHFLASLPEEHLVEDESSSDQIHFWIARYAFALFRFEVLNMKTFSEFLYGLVFEEQIDSSLKSSHEEIKCVVFALDAISQGNSKVFLEQLKFRQERRVERLRATSECMPLELIDFIGLGFCRIAINRGFAIEIQSPYLPLELLSINI